MLARLLDLHQLDQSRFLTRNHQKNFRNTLFGGQVLAQALMAAGRTVDGRPPNSMHAYFLRAGVADSHVEYQVTCLRDGKSVSTRAVNAIQNNELIFSMSASFHGDEPGYKHQLRRPQASIAPNVLLQQAANANDLHLAREASEALGSTPIEIVPYDHSIFNKQSSDKAEVRFWARSAGTLGDEALRHYCALAFASDIGLLATSLLPHNASLFAGDVFPASMDHSIWFHAQPNFERWHQYITTSPWAGSARALCLGALYDESDNLVASVSQEGLIRPTAS